MSMLLAKSRRARFSVGSISTSVPVCAAAGPASAIPHSSARILAIQTSLAAGIRPSAARTESARAVTRENETPPAGPGRGRDFELRGSIPGERVVRMEPLVAFPPRFGDVAADDDRRIPAGAAVLRRLDAR